MQLIKTRSKMLSKNRFQSKNNISNIYIKKQQNCKINVKFKIKVIFKIIVRFTAKPKTKARFIAKLKIKTRIRIRIRTMFRKNNLMKLASRFSI